jgi:histidine ammonia-lyase
MASHSEPIYGYLDLVLYAMLISNENLSKLQEKLVKSHSCGTGEEVPLEIVKLMLLLNSIIKLWIFWCSNPNSRALILFI